MSQRKNCNFCGATREEEDQLQCFKCIRGVLRNPLTREETLVQLETVRERLEYHANDRQIGDEFYDYMIEQEDKLTNLIRTGNYTS